MTVLPSTDPVCSQVLWVCAAARKRSKWLPTNKHPSRSPSSASAIQPNSAPGQGCQQQPLIKSCWPQTLSQDDSLITCENMHHAFQGAFPQPWVQHRAGLGLMPSSPCVKSQQGTQQAWNIDSYLHHASHLSDDDSLEATLHGQKHQSLRSLLGQ